MIPNLHLLIYGNPELNPLNPLELLDWASKFPLQPDLSQYWCCLDLNDVEIVDFVLNRGKSFYSILCSFLIF